MSTKDKAPHHVIFSSLLLLSSFNPKYHSQHTSLLPDLMCYPVLHLKAMRKITIFSVHNRCPGQGQKRVPPKYRPEALQYYFFIFFIPCIVDIQISQYSIQKMHSIFFSDVYYIICYNYRSKFQIFFYIFMHFKLIIHVYVLINYFNINLQYTRDPSHSKSPTF